MLHAELLHDPASLQRGEELAALYIEGLHRLRADLPSKDNYHDFKEDMQDAIETAAQREDLDSAAYEELGRSVVELHRKHEAMRAWQERGEVETPEWYAAFQPAFDFLTSVAGKPIAAEQTQVLGDEIRSLRMWSSRYPKRVGGFVIPKVAGNTGLYISRRPGSKSAIARLQIFNRDWSEDTVAYRPYLKIAIGD